MKTLFPKRKKVTMTPVRLSQRGCIKLAVAILMLVISFGLMCRAQGTMTFTFDDLPRGSGQQAGAFSEQGVWFGSHGVGLLTLSGGGVAGFPDNGTGYLYIP